jgi:PEP-CTERM motif-containing protein
MTRISRVCFAVAIAACLVFTGITFAKPAGDMPDLPFDIAATTTSNFATVASGNTHVDNTTTLPPTDTTTLPPSDSGGVTATENSPEPATLTLLGLGGLGSWWHMRRRKSAPSA